MIARACVQPSRENIIGSTCRSSWGWTSAVVEFGDEQRTGKRLLVLEKDNFAYRAALSDIAGSDIRVHRNKPTNMVSVVRAWLNGQADLQAWAIADLASGFNEFTAASYDVLTSRGFSDGDIRRLGLRELMQDMRRWIATDPVT